MLNIAQFDSMSPHHTFSGPPTASENVTVGASSVQSSVLLTGTQLVRLHAVVACRVAFGLNPTAQSTSMRLAAGQTEYFGVTPGHRIAVIAA